MCRPTSIHYRVWKKQLVGNHCIAQRALWWPGGVGCGWEKRLEREGHVYNYGSLMLLYNNGLSRCLSGKESVCQCRWGKFDIWVGMISWSRKWQPTSLFLPGKSHAQRSLAGYSPWGHKSRIWLSTHSRIQHSTVKQFFSNKIIIVRSQGQTGLPNVDSVSKSAFSQMSLHFLTEEHNMFIWTGPTIPPLFYLSSSLVGFMKKQHLGGRERALELSKTTS